MSENKNNQQEEEDIKPDVKNTSLWKKQFLKRKQIPISKTLDTPKQEEKKPNISGTSFLNNYTPKVSHTSNILQQEETELGILSFLNNYVVSKVSCPNLNGGTKGFSSHISHDHSLDVRPPEPFVDLPEPITLKVKGQDGGEVQFRIKRNVPLKKLMNEYCEHQSLSLGSIVFLFDGRLIWREQTPHQLAMEDGDEIDAMLHQTGGTRMN